MGESDDEIRARVAMHDVPLDSFGIELATRAIDFRDALTVLQTVYAQMGLTRARQPMRITPHHLLPVSMVFVAYRGDAAIGTISVTQDSAVGLPLDKDYGDELWALRDAGYRLGEIHSLAVDPEHRASGIMTLLAMVALWSLRNVLDASHAVIGVHPRAEDYYRAVYAFERFASRKTHAELGAPVVGLDLDLSGLREHLAAHFAEPLADGRRAHEHVCDRLAPCFRLALERHGSGLRPPARSAQTLHELLGLARRSSVPAAFIASGAQA